jgi:hypothetical protein
MNMTKRSLLYIIPILLIWSAQASAFNMKYDYDDVLHKFDGMHSISHGWMMAGLNDVLLNGNFNWDRHDQFKWPNMQRELPISIIDLVLKGRDFDWPGNGHFHEKPRDHTPAPVPEPATLILLGIGIISIVSGTRNRTRL